MDIEKELRRFRKKAITDSSGTLIRLDYGRTEIKRIIPHREPMLLIDRITGLDLSTETISGIRVMNEDDPVFLGHFPGSPVYPGCLEIEMIGQMGLCLYHFIKHKTVTIEDNASQVEIRATKVLGAHFLEPILPGAEVLILARKLEYDGIFAQILGQAMVKEKVCCVTIWEVYFP